MLDYLALKRLTEEEQKAVLNVILANTKDVKAEIPARLRGMQLVDAKGNTYQLFSSFKDSKYRLTSTAFKEVNKLNNTLGAEEIETLLKAKSKYTYKLYLFSKDTKTETTVEELNELLGSNYKYLKDIKLATKTAVEDLRTLLNKQLTLTSKKVNGVITVYVETR